MFNVIVEMISYPFIQRAMIVGILITLSAALIGVTLVLKRYSMIGDGLSHVGFGVLTVATSLGMTSPLFISIPIVMITSIILLKIGDNKKIKSDSIVAIISSSALAIGVAVTSVTTGLNTDVENFMFGSILAMNINDVILSIVVSIIVIVLFVVFYRKIFIVTFDEEFAKVSGLKVDRYTNLIAVLSAVVIVIGMRMMGVMLISSIIIFPAIISMRLFKSFKSVIISAGIVSVVCFLFGMYFSYAYKISTGATIVIANLIMLIIFTLIEKIKES